MKKHHVIIISLIVAGAAFYGGTLYAKASSSLPSGNFAKGSFPAGQGNFQRGQLPSGATGQNSVARGSGEEMTRGDIFSVDESSITVKTEQGGSKIIFFSDKTDITETLTVTKENLAEGKTVMVTGETNDDGSISANTIFIREAMPTPEAPKPEE